ncbi:MAG: elongation factor G [Phototrophicales bacterium]|nr:MAG: elongation factor G [Phototrophicales bacterium]RMG77524.1 MAG: elongation factor G [Chloroflexota bacterium]
MRVYKTEQIRNVALVGHQGCGKTSLVEALLFNTGAINRMGKVEDGTTVSDWQEDEKERGISLSTSLIPLEYNDHKINMLDAPGYTDFQGEVKNAIRVADAVIVVVDAVAGVEVGTELAWEYAKVYQQPIIVVINKMDRENADFDRTLNQLRELYDDHKFIPVMLPIGKEANFKGVVNVLTRKAYYNEGKDRSDLPAEMSDVVEEAHLALVEAAAEADDQLIEKYFAEEELTPDEVRMGMRKAARNHELNTVPVFVTSGTKNIGTIPLMEALIVYTSSPDVRRVGIQRDGSDEIDYLRPPQTDDGPLAVYVFKTTNDKYVGTINYFRIFSGHVESGGTYHNVDTQTDERFNSLMVMRGKETFPVEKLHAGDIGVVAKLSNTKTGNSFVKKGNNFHILKPQFPEPLYAVALTPRTQADSTKMGSVLTSLCDADPTLRWRQDPDTRQILLEGMGEAHVSLAISRAQQLGVGIDTEMPKVPYKETVTKEAEATYRHKKQSGGAGQFGEVSLRVLPNHGEGYVYETQIVGGAISSSFLPSIDKGIQGVLKDGVLAGFPIVDVKVVVFDGKEHPVDSKDIAFQIAGREAFKEAFLSASPVLMEPIMDVKITVPESMMGDIMGDLNTRRGRVQGMDTVANRSVVKAQVPLAEMLRYGNDLRSMTGGRGIYEMTFSHYERVPGHLQEEIIKRHKAELEAAQ